jgi:hypothetical protein
MEAVAVPSRTLLRWKVLDESGTTLEASTTAYITHERALDAARQRAQAMMLGDLAQREGISRTGSSS